MFFKAAPHIRPELTKYIPPDTIGHGNAEAVDHISCSVSAGWLPSPRNVGCAQRASKSRVSEMLMPGVVSRHKSTCDRMPGPSPEACVHRTNIAVVLMQYGGRSVFQRPSYHMPGIRISKTVAICLGALFPLFGRVAPLRNAGRGGGVNNR